MKVESAILIITLLAISLASAPIVSAQHPLSVQWRLVQMPIQDLQPAETRSAIGGSAWGMRGWGQSAAVHPGAPINPVLAPGAPINPGLAPGAAVYPGPGFSGAAYPAPMGVYPAPPPAAGGVYGQPGNAWGMRGWGQRG